MRLTDDQIQAIKQTAHVVLGDDARVILFGSRTDDAKKGGDIDLLFETDQAVDNRATTIGALYASLIRKLGDRKIDVILKDAATPESPVLVIARQTGIQL
ncbi:MAG: nucleotidyltransferase domain-containing protein [Methylococcales bacterium]|nr:nucleotidyltransferase domain-containing protein [Methylococcales bacterium]